MGWSILFYLLELLKWLIIARALLSWFVSPGSRHPAVELLRKITDPILRPITELLPRTGAVDLSPLIAFFIIILLQQFVLRLA